MAKAIGNAPPRSTASGLALLQARLGGDYLESLVEDFAANGREAIAKARDKDPIGYLRAIAALLPKDIAPDKPLDGLSDDELAQIIAAIRELRPTRRPAAARSRAGGAGNRTGEADEPQPPGAVPALS